MSGREVAIDLRPQACPFDPPFQWTHDAIGIACGETCLPRVHPFLPELGHRDSNLTNDVVLLGGRCRWRKLLPAPNLNLLVNLKALIDGSAGRVRWLTTLTRPNFPL